MEKQQDETEQSDENRSELRRRTLKGGKIIFNDQQSVLDCTIRNLSKTGCRIIVANQIDIPSDFELHLPGSGEKYQCQIIWRKQLEAGVKFKSWFGIG